MYIVFLGAPGAGKGTQAATISLKLKLTHIATGDLFRHLLTQESELGLEVKAYLDKGMLVPDEITIQMVQERISAPDSSTGVILDGFPRNLEQAKALDKALAQRGQAINRVVYIKVDEKELLKRLSDRLICRNCQAPYHIVTSPPKVPGKCDRCSGELYQRADDTIETVKNRLQVYFSQTTPLIDYYKGAGKLLEVNGEGDIADIGNRILAAING
ncbi:adenylate kinase [Chloroflexota bacterium]